MQKKCMGLMGAAVVAALFATEGFAAGEAYTWPTYSSKLNYNFKDAGLSYQQPTKDVSGSCVQAAKNANGVYHGKYWAFYHGANKNSLVTEASITPLLEKFDRDFSYITDTLGWPRDSRVKDGYYSAVYLYGSDACTGSNDNTEKGGWQSHIDGYPAVAASYYPVYSFDPSCPYSDKVAQQEAMIHEGIHAILTNLGAAHVHWFQEGGNTWLQQEMSVRRSNAKEYSGMGFLNAGNLMAPFVPIESYSGWLLDGTFGGPGAEGVDAGGKCNWRNTLGGVQYGNLFPTFLGLWVAEGAVPWIWVNIPNYNGKYILESMAAAVGEEQVKSIILEYRAKLALLDMKKWSTEMKTLLNQNVGSNIGCEYTPCNVTVDSWNVTPYAKTTANGNVLTPEERTTPGWSGANVIPLTVKSGATSVKLTLQKGWTQKTGNSTSTGDGAVLDGNLTNMALQIAYRATDGTPVYSTPVFGENQAVLNLSKAPQSDVVFAIVTNTTYKNDRTKHFTYKLQLDDGVSGAASITTKWYNNFKLEYDWDNAKVVTGGSSSSGTPASSSSAASSSSKTTSSSSKITSSSSQIPASSSSVVVVGETTTYSINVTLPIDDNYATVKATFDVKDVASKLGLTEATISRATFFALEPDGSTNTTSTAEGDGHWFGKNGSVVQWGENAYVFSEADIAGGTLSIGHYPNRVNNGETYSFTQGLSYNGKEVLFKVKVSITNEQGSGGSETTTALMYGLEGPATHMNLVYRNGILNVRYTLPQNDNVKVSLFTGFGALVDQQVTGMQRAGSHMHAFDLRGMPRGTYIVKVSTGSYREARPITISR